MKKHSLFKVASFTLVIVKSNYINEAGTLNLDIPHDENQETE
jgi:hypothetical protein